MQCSSSFSGSPVRMMYGGGRSPVRMVRPPVRMGGNQMMRSPVRMVRSPVRMGGNYNYMARSPVRMAGTHHMHRSPVRMVQSPVRMGRSPVRMCQPPQYAVRASCGARPAADAAPHAAHKKAASPVRMGARSSDPVIQKLLAGGAKLYGAEWCGWTKKQMAEHPDMKMLYVECKDGGCKSSDGKEVTGFPTWDIKGAAHGGFKTLKQLAELC